MVTVVGLLLATTGAVTDRDDTADTIIVRRGQTAEITGYLASGIRKHCSVEEDCQVSILGNNSRRCGYLQPERFNTSSDGVPVVFSHFGCVDTHVPLDFSILRPDGRVRFTTLEVTIAPSDHPLSHIMRSIQIVPLQTEDGVVAGKVTFNLSVTFYTTVTWQECSYSISFYPFYLEVPERGRLVGDLVNERIPCGYEPLSPIRYETNQMNTNDYLLVILWDKLSSATTTPLHGIVEIKIGAVQYNHRHTPHSKRFSVHQTGYTFVPSNLLIPPPHSLASLPASTRLYSSSTSCGRFVTPFRPRHAEDDSRTLITRNDLQSNAVAFHQSFANCSKIDYHLRAYDIAGVLLWKMVVKVIPHSVHTAPTLHCVAHEGSTLNITSMLLSLTESFGNQCTFRLLHQLEGNNVLWTTAHGLNISAVGKYWSRPLEPGSLWYTAGGQNDALVWRVACVNWPSIRNVTALITVISKDKLPLMTAFERSEVHVYDGYATQLDSRLLHWTDPDTDDFAAVYHAVTDLFILNLNISNAADTILPLADLGVQVNLGTHPDNVVKFSHADWLNGRIWIAAGQSSTSKRLLIFLYSLPSGHHLLDLDIRIHSSPPPEPLSSFKKATAVRVVLDTNLPLKLSNEGTSSYIVYETRLKARVQGPVSATPIPIMYHIHVAPQHGYICVGLDSCTETAHNFTQLDIQSFVVRYVRREISEVDGFSFSLDDSDGQIHWFVIRMPQSVFSMEPCGNSHLYIPVPKGGRTALAVESFQPPLSEEVELEVVRPPQHGSLTSNSFSGTALIAGNVSYTSHNSSQVVCTDETILSVSTNSSHSIIVLRFAVMTATSNPINLSTSLLRVSINGYSALTARHLNISGVPFCPELVLVKITSAPQFGALKTSNAFDFKLKEGCSFSQLQLKQDKVTYSIIHGNRSMFFDSISFLVTVPLIGDYLNITTKEFSMDFYYSNQSTGQLTVAPELPVRPIDVEDDLLYGVTFEVNKTINVSLPEYVKPNRFVLMFEPANFAPGSFIGVVQHRIDLGSVFWLYPDITVPLIYYFNALSLHNNASSIQMNIYSGSLSYDNNVQYLFHTTSVRVYWSHVSFSKTHVRLEAKQEPQEISIEIQ